MEAPKPVAETDVIRTLAELPDTTIVSEEALCRIFARSTDSIKRAVQRGELPPPVRLFGKPSWTVRVLVRFIEKRLEQAALDAAEVRLTLEQRSP